MKYSFSSFRHSQRISKMDETTTSEKSPQIKLTLPASEPIQSPTSVTKSPTQNRKQQLLPQSTAMCNVKSKYDISLEIGSATGMNTINKRKFSL